MSATIRQDSKRIRSGRLFAWMMLIAFLTALAPNPYTAQPGAAQGSQPNIVLIISDDQSLDSLPVMRKLVSYPEGSWVKFNNAFISNPICCPSRATLLTGQYSFHTRVTKNIQGDRLNDANTLAVWLDQAGYRTGLIGHYLNGFPWDRGANYMPPGWDYFRTTNLGGNADGVTGYGVDFINSATEPFFLHLGYWDPHEPANPLPRYANAEVFVPPDRANFSEADVSDKPKWVRDLEPLSQATIDIMRAERLASQRALLGVDDGIQTLLDTLKARGVLENTLVIFLADNGYSWGSHNWIKKNCVYEECIRVPLFIRYPGLGANREEEAFVSNVDLASTIAEYAGVTPGLPQDGRSLLPLLNGGGAAGGRAFALPESANDPLFMLLDFRSFFPLVTGNGTANTLDEAVFLEVHAWSLKQTFNGIRVPGWTYAEYANGDKELYDLEADPFQLENLANQPAYQDIAARLAQRMREKMGN